MFTWHFFSRRNNDFRITSECKNVQNILKVLGVHQDKWLLQSAYRLRRQKTESVLCLLIEWPPFVCTQVYAFIISLVFGIDYKTKSASSNKESNLLQNKVGLDSITEVLLENGFHTIFEMYRNELLKDLLRSYAMEHLCIFCLKSKTSHL